jgi:hypothetical protein
MGVVNVGGNLTLQARNRLRRNNLHYACWASQLLANGPTANTPSPKGSLLQSMPCHPSGSTRQIGLD